MVYKFFDKKSKGSGLKENQRNYLQNSQLAEDNIWGVDLADIHLISKHNKGIRYLLCVIDLFSKYACVVPLKDIK